MDAQIVLGQADHTMVAPEGAARRMAGPNWVVLWAAEEGLSFQST